MEPSSFTYKLTPHQGVTLKAQLEAEGFTFAPLAHGHFQATKGKCKVAFYLSGKLVVQGKGAREWIEFSLEPLVLGEARLGYEEVVDPEMFSPHFGIDESGKGDFFGPLVVAGAYVDAELCRELAALGVKDSKRIGSDPKAIALSAEIQRVLRGKCEVLVIGPARYNELYGRFGNLNRMLAWAHAKVIELLCAKMPDCPRALSDQFANPALIQRELNAKGLGIQLDQRIKAESDLAVAAASVLARAEFLQRLDRLGTEAGVRLRKGASASVKAIGVEIVRRGGQDALRAVAKAHFKTFAECIEEGREAS
ncbi:MAG: ribonuclease HIII [Candidatus Methylacidiphilales bacterium]